jgi:hypothetical protein
MKPTEFIVENSIIAQEADDMHRDHEVQMARSQMYSSAQAAIEIHRLLRDISEMEGLEGWVQSKLTLASQYLESVRDYLKYEAVSQEPEMMAFAEDAADYAIEKMIQEDDQEGRARKPGGDYVNPDAGYGSSRYRDRILSTPPGEINPGLQKYAERNTPRKMGDPGLPGAKDNYSSNRPEGARVRDFTIGGQIVGGTPTKIERPGGVPKVEKTPITRFSMPGSSDHDPRLGADLDPKMMMKRSMKEQTPAAGTSTPVVGGMSKSTDTSGRTTTSYDMGPVSVSKSTGGGIPDVTSASAQVMDKTVTQHTGVGFGGASAGVQQGGNKITTVTEKNKLKEMATGGSSSASGVSVSMSGPGHKSTSGVPKKLGNSHKSKQVTVGKGVYDK